MKEKESNKHFNDALHQLMYVEQPPFSEKTPYFSANMPASKSLRLILFKFYLNIIYYRNKLLQSHEDEDLHQLRVNIRKSRTFIKTFSFLFKKDLDVIFLTQLSKIASYTNKKRDLDVIRQRLQNDIKTKSHLSDALEVQIKKETKKIDAMLKSDNVEHFLDYYKETLLHGDELFINHKKDKKIQKVAKQTIQQLQHTIQKRIKILEKKFSVKKLHKIRISFKKLRYLLEEFAHLFNEEKISLHIKEVKDLQTVLGDFNDTINQKKLIAKYVDKYNNEADTSHKQLMQITSKQEQTLIEYVVNALHAYKKKTLQL